MGRPATTMVYVGLVCMLGLVPACKKSQDPSAQPTLIEMSTEDGHSLSGQVYRPDEGASPPGLLLLHMYNSDANAWKRFAEDARQAGYVSLAYDMRGHGQSTAVNWSPKSSADPWRDEDVLSAMEDIRIAKRRLLKEGADPENLFIVGASIGANMALTYALEDSEIHGIVLLSPGLKYKNVSIETSIGGMRERPVLLIAADGDSYAASSAQALHSGAPGYCELRTYAGSAHGTNLLDAHEAVVPQIFQWLGPLLSE